MGPLSPKFTSSRKTNTTKGNKLQSNVQLFQAALLVTLKRNPASPRNVIPTISQCYPRDQLAKLPSRLEHFCFPDVDNIRPRERQAGTSFTFVLTAGDGARTYGFCRRYLPCGRPQQVRLDVGKRLPECLCIVSAYPYFPVFDYVLKTLQVRRWLTPSDMAPFLREMISLRVPERGEMFEVSVKKKTAGRLTATTHRHTFVRPEDDRVPLTSHGVRTFFTRFTPSLVRHILGAVLLERRVIFHSTSIGAVSSVIYSTLALLYPFEWQHILVPLLPQNLLEYTCAPSPYIVGIHTSHLQQVKRLPIGEVLIVSVDTGTIVAYGNYDSIPIGAASRGRTGSGTALAAADLVKDAAKDMLGGMVGALNSKYREEPLPSASLTRTFEKLYNRIVATKNDESGGGGGESDNAKDRNRNRSRSSGDSISASRQKHNNIEESWSNSVDVDGLSRMMLTYFASIFEHLYEYVQGVDLFDRDGFLASHHADVDVQRVLQVLMQTQHFEHFLGQRLSSSSFLFDGLVRERSKSSSSSFSSSISTRVKHVLSKSTKQDMLSTRYVNLFLRRATFDYLFTGLVYTATGIKLMFLSLFLFLESN
jgi:hypothetical protein